MKSWKRISVIVERILNYLAVFYSACCGKFIQFLISPAEIIEKKIFDFFLTSVQARKRESH